MKKNKSTTLKLLVVFILFSLGVYISESYFKENVGVNNKYSSIKLRLKADSSLPSVDFLPKNKYVVIKAIATRWVYIYWNDRVLVASKNVLETGYYRFYKAIVIESELFQFSKYALACVFLVMILSSTRNNARRNKRIHINEARQSVEAKAQARSSREKSPIQPESRQVYKEVIKIPKRDNQPVVNEKERIKEIEQYFYEKAKKELNAAYKNKLETMEKAVEGLKLKYAEAQRIALTFEIDLTDGKIDTLVKGREFELFAAKIWHEDARTLIEDWTPDKGIKEGIYVKSNGYPDFLVSITTPLCTRKVAVECKYRSEFQPNKNGEQTYVSWADFNNVDVYRKYKHDKNIEVYILLGVAGEALNPEYLYLAKLESIFDASFEHGGLSETWSTTKRKMKSYRIEPDQLIQQIINMEIN